MSSREDLPTYLGTRKVLACGPRALSEKSCPPLGMVREHIFIFDSVESTENCTEGERNFPQIFFLDNNRGLLMIRLNELAGGPSDVFRY